jgi:hypothetical protein
VQGLHNTDWLYKREILGRNSMFDIADRSVRRERVGGNALKSSNRRLISHVSDHMRIEDSTAWFV